MERLWHQSPDAEGQGEAILVGSVELVRGTGNPHQARGVAVVRNGEGGEDLWRFDGTRRHKH